jgi:hypothetical protein
MKEASETSSRKKCCPIWKYRVFFYETSIIMNWIITIYYWALLTDWCNIFDKVNCFRGFIDHLIPFILTMIDFSTNAVPIKGSHFILTLVLATIYLIFNYISTIVGGKPIYP